MGHLAWGGLGLLGGAGGLVATGHANPEVAAVMAVVALGALAAAFIWRVSHPGNPKDEGRRD